MVATPTVTCVCTLYIREGGSCGCGFMTTRVTDEIPLTHVATELGQNVDGSTVVIR